MNFLYEMNGTESLQNQRVSEDDFISSEPPLSCYFPEQAVQQTRYSTGQLWSNDFLWPPSQPMQMPHRPMSMAVEGSANGEPGLSSHSTSRKSSVNPPVTPTMPSRRTLMSSNDIGYFNGQCTGPDDQDEDQRPLDPDPKADRSFMGVHFSTPVYPSHQPDPWLETIPEQPWESPSATSSQLSSQQSITTPQEWPASDSLLNQRIHAMAGTWQSTDGSIWYRCNEVASSWDATNAAGHHQQHQHRSVSHASAGTNYAALHARNEPLVDEEFPPVPCGQCGRIYTGRWGNNNMHRHVRLKHATELPREYVCRVCQKSYNRIDALRIHERLKHSMLHRASATRR